MNPIKEKRRLLKLESDKFGSEFVELPCTHNHPQGPIKVWRNKHYLAQLYSSQSRQLRLSINRAEIDSSGDWKDGISWDALQAIKSTCGFGNFMAVEIYPEDSELVYDHNIRHLWLLRDRLPFAWTKENAVGTKTSDTEKVLIS